MKQAPRHLPALPETGGWGEGRCPTQLGPSLGYRVPSLGVSPFLLCLPCGCLGGPWRASEEVGPVLNPPSWPEAPVRDAAGLRPVPVGSTWHNPAAWGAPQASSSSPSSLPRTLGPPRWELPWALSDSPGNQADGMGPQGDLRAPHPPPVDGSWSTSHRELSSACGQSCW